MSRSIVRYRPHAFGLLALASSAGCFPYGETYRPAITGRVVDDRGAPVAGAPIETCSASRWHGLRGKCPRPATTLSGADGTFSVPRKKETEWCCFGEAPLPFTIVSVCMPDGRLGGATFDSAKDPTEVTIPIAPPASMSVVRPRTSSAARSYDPDADVRQRCGASSEAPR